MTVWKFVVGLGDDATICGPQDLVPLHVGMQNGVLCMWALVNPDAPMKDRKLYVRGTGHSLDGREGRYIGTAIDEARGLVWHVFDDISEDVMEDDEDDDQ